MWIIIPLISSHLPFPLHSERISQAYFSQLIKFFSSINSTVFLQYFKFHFGIICFYSFFLTCASICFILLCLVIFPGSPEKLFLEQVPTKAGPGPFPCKEGMRLLYPHCCETLHKRNQLNLVFTSLKDKTSSGSVQPVSHTLRRTLHMVLLLPSWNP